MTIARIGPVRTVLPILTGLLVSGSVLTSGAGAGTLQLIILPR